MKDPKYPPGIGLFGRWLIFWGAPMVAVAVLICSGRSLEQTFGITRTAYFFLGTVAALWLLSSILYERYIPQRLIIPIGIVGWAVTLSLLSWYFWFGAGAFKL